jgi:hypothetical protein
MVGTTERIKIGPLEIRFLLESKATAGSLAMFEFDVPANARVPIAHSHDGYEETCTVSTIRAAPIPRCWRWSPPAC